MEKSYRYMGYFLLLLIPLILVGFYQTYSNQFPDFNKITDNSIHVHAFIAAIWVAILIAQPFLIVYKKLDWHRIVGKVSYVVFPLLVLSFIPGTIKIYHSGNYKNMFFTLADCAVMTFFYVLAVYYKKDSKKHMRYMIASAIMLLGPTLGRIFPHLFGFSEVATQNGQFICIIMVLAALIWYDYQNKSKYQPYVVAIAPFSIHQLVFYYLFL
jgi:hypothetical protein